MSEGNLPANTFRIGLVKATVWKNLDKFYNVVLSKSYSSLNLASSGVSSRMAFLKVALSANDKMNPYDTEAFVDSLPMRGRISLLKLLKASGCGQEESLLIDCFR
jgi:hypothetical protein